MTGLVIEVVKVLVTGALTYAKQKGLTDEEFAEVLETAKEEFKQNDPANLADV